MADNYQVQMTFTAAADDVLSSLDAMSKGLSSVSAKTQEVGSVGEQAIGGSLTGSIIKAELVVEALKKTMEVVLDGFKEFLKTGIEFNKTIESATIGISTLVGAQNDISDSTGRVLKGQEGFNAAMAIGEETMTKLRLASFKTTATFQELTTAFQQGLGPMQQAGLTLDQSVEMTQRFAQAAGALNRPIFTLGHELAATFSGTISSRITRIIKSVDNSITSDTIKRWQQAGTVFEEMNKRLAYFELSGNAIEASWKGVTSNLMHAFEAFAGEGTQPLFDKLKEGLHSALHDAFNMNTGGFSAAFGGLLEGSRELFDEIGSMASDAIGWFINGVKAVSAFMGTHHDDLTLVFNDIRITTGQIGGLLSDILKDMGHLVGLSGEAAGGFTTLEYVVVSIGIAIAGVRDGISVVLGGLLTVASYLMKGVLIPVHQILDNLGQGMNQIHKGAGDMLLSISKGFGDVVNKVQEFGKSTAGAVFTGHGAVQGLLDDLSKVPGVVDKAIASTKGYHAKGKGQGEDGGRDENVQAKLLLDLKKDLDAAQQKLTLDEKQSAEESAIKLQSETRLLEIKKALAAGKISGDEAAQDRAKAEEVIQAQLQSVRVKYDQLRKDAAEKIQGELTQAENVGLAQRIAAIQAHFIKIRQEVKKASASQITEAQIAAAEQTAIENAKNEAVERDLKRLRAAFVDLAKEKGRALTMGEQLASLDQLAAKLGISSEAVARLRTEMLRTQNGMAGFKAGLADFAVKAQNTFENVKAAVTSAFQGMTSAISGAITGIVTGTMKAGDALKSMIKGMATSVVSAVAQMVAQWLIAKAAQMAFGTSAATATGAQAVAQQESAAASLWNAYAWMPFVGPGIATAMIALMNTSLATNAVAAKGIVAHAKGGVINSPTLALMGEGNETEIVANETSFRDWGMQMMGLGAALGSSLASADKVVHGYNRTSASYARGASGGGVIHVENHYHQNAPNWDPSERSKEQAGQFFNNALQTYARRSGQVLDTSKTFGAAI